LSFIYLFIYLLQVPRYDADRLVSKLVQKCRSSTRSSTFFDWTALGSEAGICFNAIPSRVSFLNGPLQDGVTLQVKQRVQRQRPVEEDTTEEAKPEDVLQGAQTKDCDQLSAVEQSMKVLEKVLHKQVRKTYTNHKKRLLDEHDGELPPEVSKRLKKHGTDLCAIQYMFNPTSFTQTVENIFHYSFLIKKGSAQIALREKLSEFGPAGPVVKYKDENSHRPQPKQCIATLTMKDWRELCAAYQVEKGDVPNRTGSKQHKGRASGATQTQTQSSQLSQESSH
jgi:hypothetical protein